MGLDGVRIKGINKCIIIDGVGMEGNNKFLGFCLEGARLKGL